MLTYIWFSEKSFEPKRRAFEAIGLPNKKTNVMGFLDWIARLVLEKEQPRSNLGGKDFELLPLREIYPADLYRQRIHCVFAHDYLPDWVHENSKRVYEGLLESKAVDASNFIRLIWRRMEMEAKSVAGPKALEGVRISKDCLVSDLSAQSCDFEGRTGVLIEMPKEEVPPVELETELLVFFLAVVFEKADRARVFTLERMVDSPAAKNADEQVGLVCEWKAPHMHKNHGMDVPVRKEDFAPAVCELLKREDAHSECSESGAASSN